MLANTMARVILQYINVSDQHVYTLNIHNDIRQLYLNLKKTNRVLCSLFVLQATLHKTSFNF